MRHDDVDLLVEHSVFLGHGDRDEEDAEDVVAVRLQCWTRLVLMTGRRDEQLKCRLLDRPWQLRANLVRGRIDQVDPLGHNGRG